MTSVEHTARQAGPIILHITTQAADVQIVADPRVTGTVIELSTADTDGPAVTAIRNARFRDDGRDVHLTLNEGQRGGMTVNQNFRNIPAGITVTGVTMVNGVVIGGGYVSSGITVRAITEPGSTVVVETMSGDVITRNVTGVRAKTMSGDIEADGITDESSLSTMSGDIRVTGGTGTIPGRAVARPGAAGPRVTASTMSGDVTGRGVDLNASSMSGRVRRG
jgi:hypothetical protein